MSTDRLQVYSGKKSHDTNRHERASYTLSYVICARVRVQYSGEGSASSAQPTHAHEHSTT